MDDVDTEAEWLHRTVRQWYADNARDLPWREPGASPWGILVSEVMLQQTPVARVLPVWREWQGSWPRSADLAAAGRGEVVRAWGKLGYPRRALRLHEAATGIARDFGGEVPHDYDDLRSLPGIGDYTAAAVAAFAFGRRHVVLDTNVRRVLARVVTGDELPPRSVRRLERVTAEELLPGDGQQAAAWSVGVMELGALVCRVAAPRCDACPLRARCAWRLAGYPPDAGPPRPVQTFAGTDRQCRGRLLDVLRGSESAVHRSALEAAWDPREQRERALAGLLADGLVEQTGPDTYSLPR